MAEVDDKQRMRILSEDGETAIGTSGAPLYISFATGSAITASSVTDSGLTSGRVVIAGTAGLLGDDADLTFATATLTATNMVVTTALTQGASGSIAAGTGGVSTTGDVSAAGGFRQTVSPFTATLAADQTATATTWGLAGAGAWVAPRAGSVTAISAHLDAAITGATKTAIPGVYKNGTIINAASILTFTTGGAETDLYLAIAKDTYTFAAGDRIDIRYTSTTITNTPKMWVSVEVEC